MNEKPSLAVLPMFVSLMPDRTKRAHFILCLCAVPPEGVARPKEKAAPKKGDCTTKQANRRWIRSRPLPRKHGGSISLHEQVGPDQGYHWGPAGKHRATIGCCGRLLLMHPAPPVGRAHVLRMRARDSH